MSNSVRPHRRQPTRLPRPWDSPGKNTGVSCHFLLQCMEVKSERKLLSHVRPSATPWTATHQAPPSMGFSRQEYWSGVPLPSPIVVYTDYQSLRKTLLTSAQCLMVIRVNEENVTVKHWMEQRFAHIEKSQSNIIFSSRHSIPMASRSLPEATGGHLASYASLVGEGPW